MTFIDKDNSIMDNESANPFDVSGIESIKGHEVMESLGVVDAASSDYVQNDDVANSIAEGDF